ncbi:plexin-B1-like [Mytilus californianus]|uniref:plexin-B1-like n=1 Tax=Mytilus californianus TaxID=6549 RepID=UPI002245E56A|nr:plexin-B1-like [Mytilus californianus]
MMEETSGNMLSVLLIHTTVVLTVAAQINLTPYGHATQSSVTHKSGPQNALKPPVSNEWGFDKCTHTVHGHKTAWWMFEFDAENTYITDIEIFYREKFANRMDGFKLYVTNTSTIPPDGYLCYEDPDPGFPNITQTIPCNQLGKYVIYYDIKGDENYGPIVELCYVSINGCRKNLWGRNCTQPCSENCIENHCYPGNGSCVWGCKDINCLNDVCDKDTLICTEGCKGGRTGRYCNKYAKYFGDSEMTVKCTPEIYKVYPSSGPLRGGTMLTISGKYIGNIKDKISVDIGGVRCHNVTVETPNLNLTCVTGKSNTNHMIQTKGIFVTVNANIFNDTNTTYFSYQNSTILEFSPTKSFISGNTTVTIKGPNIGFEGQNRYNISFCDMYNCIECSAFPDTLSSNYTKCKTGKSSRTRNMTRLQVIIDDLTMLHFKRTFRYLPDPKFNTFNRSPKSQLSGGATFTVRGEGFTNVEEVTVERMDKHCDVPEDTLAVCKTPQKLGNQPNNQTVYVHFDDVTLPVTIEYVEDPTFEKFPDVYEYDKESSIQIKGRNILNGARLEDYRIHVGLDGSCLLTDIDMQLIICFPPKSVPRTNKTDVNTVHVIVDVGNIKAYIGDLQYKADSNILAITVGMLTAALVTAVVIGGFIIRKKKKRTTKEYRMELLTREEMIREASREEFADAQMSIRDIKSDLVTSRVPFCNYQTYILHQLFPNQDMTTNILLQDLEITDDRQTVLKSAMDKLETLLTNKIFLKSLIQTLDRPNMITMQEKAHFSSVLSISLLGNMRLFFDLIHCLLTDMIRSLTKKQQKLLFRRFDSIAMRLMVNWLQIGLYRQLTSHSGMQLFMLYKAVQTTVEIGPIDALTGNSKNTIAEEKLLKMRSEHQTMTLQIDLNGNSDQHYPVNVLDCDTISQVKQKCCAQIYKNKPASEIPHINELSLEWQNGTAGKLSLNDIDNTSERNNGLVSLNTLKHYMVTDNSRMTLMYRQHDEEDAYVSLSRFGTESVRSEDIALLVQKKGDDEEPETHKWHLSNLPDDVKSTQEVVYGDIFLNRLFQTKLLLADYIDSTFEGLEDQQSLSISIRYFFCMLDRFGKDYKIDSEVLQSWKNECYATRIWAPLIGKPDILFDVNVPGHVEPCLDILRQVVMESFTQTAQEVNKESPTQKLLFHKDILRYRDLIDPFFARVMPVTDQEFWSEIDEMSKRQKADLKFSRQSTLDQLYQLFIVKYRREIIDDLEDMEESKDLKEEVIDLMEETSSDS